jgi:hypothetical protein
VYQPTVDEMRDLTRRVVDNVTSAVHLLSLLDAEADAASECGRRTSSSMSDLPDPSGLDLNPDERSSSAFRRKLSILEQQVSSMG